MDDVSRVWGGSESRNNMKLRQRVVEAVIRRSKNAGVFRTIETSTRELRELIQHHEGVFLFSPVAECKVCFLSESTQRLEHSRACVQEAAANIEKFAESALKAVAKRRCIDIEQIARLEHLVEVLARGEVQSGNEE